jgi:hypothetical protein
MRRALAVGAFAALIAVACEAQPQSPTRAAAPPVRSARLAELDALVAAYPDALARHDGVTLTWRDGARMAVSDGNERKSPAQIIEAPDIDDIFAWPYPLGAPEAPPAQDVDPGRARPQAFFIKMYGDCRRGEVSVRLAEVRWPGGKTVRFTTVNGANRALARVARDLEALGPSFADYLRPTAGTYNCRVVAGTEAYSMHAFGAAIDLNTRYGDYWRWAGGRSERRAPYRNRMPMAIVAVFERHGFIWGGRWSHFDTFHFEYRPELILAARRAHR